MKIFRAQELERKATSERLKRLHRRRVDEKELLGFVNEVARIERDLIETKEKLAAAEASLVEARASILACRAAVCGDPHYVPFEVFDSLAKVPA
jgi:hypothetical protein